LGQTLIAAYQRDAFRVVYTVAFPKAVFVLHAFQKKSKTGIATPRKDISLIRQRLAKAAEAYRRLDGDE
jgi:phage-related protein